MSTPSIQVDDEVYKALQARAVPLEDSANDVLRRLLRIDEELAALPVIHPVAPTSPVANAAPVPRRARQMRSRDLDATPKEDYWIPILQFLADNGGQARTADALEHLSRTVRLRPDDLKPITTGEERWRNRAKWARKDMMMSALIASNSPHGLWEITDRGREYLTAH